MGNLDIKYGKRIDAGACECHLKAGKSDWCREKNDKCKNSEFGFSYLHAHISSALWSKEIRNMFG